jgi:hypothetical protein
MNDGSLEWVASMASDVTGDAASDRTCGVAKHPATAAATDEGAAAVVAGTLCLMSCFSQHPLPLYAQRVAGNLHRLAANPAMTPELRSVCRRLSCQWDGIADDARRSVDQGMLPADSRPLH